jgi:hypothetical protein
MPIYVNCQYCAKRRCALEHAQKAHTHWRHVGELWWCRHNSKCIKAFKVAQHPNGDGPPSHRYTYTPDDVFPEEEEEGEETQAPPSSPHMRAHTRTVTSTSPHTRAHAPSHSHHHARAQVPAPPAPAEATPAGNTHGNLPGPRVVCAHCDKTNRTAEERFDSAVHCGVFGPARRCETATDSEEEEAEDNEYEYIAMV